MTIPPASRIDHLAVTAPTLEAGVAWVEQLLGVPMEPGGEHPLMGTHNRLLRLGDGVYLEVITANPQAAAPGRPRWFALDALAPGDPPRLRNWVARTNDIAVALAAAGEALGTIIEQRRDGLRWLMTIPDDGKPLMGGTAPALIEWKTGPHPAARLPERGLRLERLELVHPRPHRVQALLDAIGIDDPVVVRHSPEGEGSSLVAHIATPGGLRSLSIAD